MSVPSLLVTKAKRDGLIKITQETSCLIRNVNENGKNMIREKNFFVEFLKKLDKKH